MRVKLVTGEEARVEVIPRDRHDHQTHAEIVPTPTQDDEPNCDSFFERRTCSPTRTPTRTPTFTPTRTPTRTPTFTLTRTPTKTPIITPSNTPGTNPSERIACGQTKSGTLEDGDQKPFGDGVWGDPYVFTLDRTTAVTLSMMGSVPDPDIWVGEILDGTNADFRFGGTPPRSGTLQPGTYVAIATSFQVLFGVSSYSLTLQCRDLSTPTRTPTRTPTKTPTFTPTRTPTKTPTPGRHAHRRTPQHAHRRKPRPTLRPPRLHRLRTCAVIGRKTRAKNVTTASTTATRSRTPAARTARCRAVETTLSTTRIRTWRNVTTGTPTTGTPARPAATSRFSCSRAWSWASGCARDRNARSM